MDDHIKSIVGKAEARFRFIGRILRKCGPKTKEIGYSTLVRPLLEYCSPVWDPYQVRLIKEINKIQRRAVCFVTGSFGNRESVTEMIDKPQRMTLQERRSVARYGRFSRSDLEDKIRDTRAHTEAYRQSFFPRTIRDWKRRENQ